MACPHTLPSCALAVGCGALGGELHTRNHVVFETLHRLVPGCPRWGPRTSPVSRCLAGGATDAWSSGWGGVGWGGGGKKQCSYDTRNFTGTGGGGQVSRLKKSTRKVQKNASGVQESWLQNSTSQHNTTQHNTTQHNTTQHNTTQHNTTQHSTTQHNTTPEYSPALLTGWVPGAKPPTTGPGHCQ